MLKNCLDVSPKKCIGLFPELMINIILDIIGNFLKKELSIINYQLSLFKYVPTELYLYLIYQ